MAITESAGEGECDDYAPSCRRRTIKGVGSLLREMSCSELLLIEGAVRGANAMLDGHWAYQASRRRRSRDKGGHHG